MNLRPAEGASDGSEILADILIAAQWEGPAPETDDSVEQLRYAAATAASQKYGCEPQISINDLNKAADEIERLRAENKWLRPIEAEVRFILERATDPVRWLSLEEIHSHLSEILKEEANG